jgi:acyl carrier protein
VADKLITLFSEVLSLDEARLDDNSSSENTPKWNSLSHMMLIASIEEKFCIEFMSQEIAHMRTIGAVRKILESHNIDCT